MKNTGNIPAIFNAIQMSTHGDAASVSLANDERLIKATDPAAPDRGSREMGR